MVPSLPLLSCESSVSLKENPDRNKKKTRIPIPYLARSDSFSLANRYSDCNSGIDLVVVLEYTFFQLFLNDKQTSVRLTRFRKSYVNRPAVLLTNHTSYTAFWLDVRCAVQSGHDPFFTAVFPNDSALA